MTDSIQLSIPRRIVQTGKHVRPPLSQRASIASIVNLNPGFVHEYFDNPRVDEFVRSEFPQYLKVFQDFAFPIQRYDFFRYLAIYRHGGFYFDLDIFLAAGLEDLLESRCVFPFEGLTFSRHLRDRYGMDWQIGNYAFGAVAGHPFLGAVIENCVRAQKDPSWAQPMMKGMPRFSRDQFLVLNTTGPGLLSRTLAENPSLSGAVSVPLSKRCVRPGKLELLRRVRRSPDGGILAFGCAGVLAPEAGPPVGGLDDAAVTEGECRSRSYPLPRGNGPDQHGRPLAANTLRNRRGG